MNAVLSMKNNMMKSPCTSHNSVAVPRETCQGVAVLPDGTPQPVLTVVAGV